MDLFGDLPQAKNSTLSTSISEANGATKQDGIEPGAKKARIETERKLSSIQKALGTAGTTRAFVPLALRRAATIKKFSPKPKSVLDEVQNESKNPSINTTFQVDYSTIEKCVEQNLESPSKYDRKEESRTEEAQSVPLTEELLEMRALHASVTDPYDPFHPNDYLAYKQELEREEKRKELERRTLEALKQQEIMQEQISRERQKLAQGMGRGRGLNNLPSWVGQSTAAPAAGRGMGVRDQRNLPAWLVQKQRDEASNSLRLVALYNMLAPGETDDELADEVKDECEARCGPVEKILISDLKTQIKVFVLFRSSSDALKAFKVFDCRSFGGRLVSAQCISSDEMPS